LVGGAVLTVGLLGGSAWAAPSQGFTSHGDGTGPTQVEVDFFPSPGNPSPSLPAGCWLSANDAIVSTGGNQIMHGIGNKNGGWFTTTYTGDAAVFPLVLDANGSPIPDLNTGNNEVNTSVAPLATGHLTTWFGDENNGGVKNDVAKVDVEHATASFHGTDANGNAVNLNGHFHIGTNQYGQPTATVGSVTC
jgi:hypothetical protein